ncbi:MAG: hypothetical protein KL840_12225 [Aquamicrobium sp.]|nr:hypothetical protein [Aquamicrobium sp.]
MYHRLAPLLLFPLAGCVSASSADVTRELAVGQTAHITAYRGDGCNAPAPSFEAVMRRIPKSELVRYSDGGLSSRVSDQCKKRVPTRAVNGTGIKAGSEVKRYQSGTVAIVVK